MLYFYALMLDTIGILFCLVWMEQINAKDLTILFLITWNLWGQINKWIYEKHYMDPRRAIEQGMSIQALFTECAASLPKELNKAGCWRPQTQALSSSILMVLLSLILTVNIYEKGFRDLATIECLIMFKVLQLYFNLVIQPYCH